jgi:hypothetical protein
MLKTAAGKVKKRKNKNKRGREEWEVILIG